MRTEGMPAGTDGLPAGVSLRDIEEEETSVRREPGFWIDENVPLLKDCPEVTAEWIAERAARRAAKASDSPESLLAGGVEGRDGDGDGMASPGPWRYNRFTTEVLDAGGFRVGAAIGSSSAEQDANGRLMAAAPALRDACNPDLLEEAASIIYHTPPHQGVRRDDLVAALREKAGKERAAIKAAEGSGE